MKGHRPLPGYRNVKDFDPPEGVQTNCDRSRIAWRLANSELSYDERRGFFVAGSGPTQLLPNLHGGPGQGNYLFHRFPSSRHIFGGGGDKRKKSRREQARRSTTPKPASKTRTGQGRKRSPLPSEVKEDDKKKRVP